jgi:hypothetical protein
MKHRREEAPLRNMAAHFSVKIPAHYLTQINSMFKLLGSGEILSFSLDQEKPVRSAFIRQFATVRFVR